MKKLSALTVAIAGALLGSYYVTGMITERTVKENLDAVNQSNGLFAEVENYQRGWFSSTANLDWRLHIPERVVKTEDGKEHTEPAQDYEMKMPLSVSHGPIIFSKSGVKFGLGYAQTDLNLPEKLVKQFSEYFTSDSTQPTIDLSLFVNYFNHSRLQMGVPAFHLNSKKGDMTLDWKGMSSSVSASSHMDKVDGGFVIDGFHVVNKQVDTEVGELSAEYDLHKTDAGLYLGDANLSLPMIKVVNNGKELFELDEFYASTESDVDDGLFNTFFKTTLGKLVAEGKTYGPGRLEFSIRNLDATVLAHINELANKAQNGTDAEKQQAMLAMLPDLPKLFSRGAEFEISDLSFTMPDGKVEGNMMISIMEGGIKNPFEIMSKLRGEGRLVIPAAVLKQVLLRNISQKAPQANAAPMSTDDMQAAVDKQMSNMLASGLLSQNNDNMVLEMKFNDGQFVVNGKPFRSEMMAF